MELSTVCWADAHSWQWEPRTDSGPTPAMRPRGVAVRANTPAAAGPRPGVPRLLLPPAGPPLMAPDRSLPVEDRFNAGCCQSLWLQRKLQELRKDHQIAKTCAKIRAVRMNSLQLQHSSHGPSSVSCLIVCKHLELGPKHPKQWPISQNNGSTGFVCPYPRIMGLEFFLGYLGGPGKCTRSSPFRSPNDVTL